MALHEQNRFLQILHKNGATRKQIDIIMSKYRCEGFFIEPDTEDDIDWEAVDKKADIWFSDLKPQEKLEAIENISIEKETESVRRRNKFFDEAEKRVQAKMEEMEARGLTGPDIEEETVEQSTTRYGRNPLHEAIAMRDIRLVKKYIKKNLYLTTIDNNGHTPMEMAYYEGYKEAMVVFNAHKSKK